MKKLIRSVTSAFMALVLGTSCLISSGSILFASAATTESKDIYQISTAEDMLWAAENPQNNYLLTNDIDLSGIANWAPIGTESNPFSGVFNGAGHTVTLGIDQTKTESGIYMVGLFGYVTGTVSNLQTEGTVSAKIYSGYIGSVAANLAGGMLINCINNAVITAEGTGTDKTGTVHVGGIAGAVRSGFTAASVQHCINNGTVNVKAQNLPKGSGDLGDGTNGTVGGIVGYTCTAAQADITNSINNGDININGGSDDVGGILGMTSSNNNNSKANITYCANKGDITILNLQGERAAGIVGYIKNGVINYCYNTGNVLTYSDNGITPSRIGYGTNYGIFGYANINADAPLQVKYCYNASEVPLEAEICLIRNAKYGTFQNFYMQGREEYELELKGEAGTAGTAFSSADDLLEKITASSDGAYTANPNQGGYPVLYYEAATQLPDEAYAGEIKAEILGNRLQNLYFVLQTGSTVSTQGLEITASLLKDSEEIASVPLAAAEGFNAGAVSYKAADGCKLYGAGIYSAAGLWTQAVITVKKDSKELFTKSLSNSDTQQSVEIPFEGIPDYPEGTISSVYNAGPGLAADETAVTSEDSQMIIISKTYSDTFVSYVESLSENGFTKLSENEAEGNIFYSLRLDEQLYYMYYTAHSQTVRIIQDNSTTVLPEEIDSDPVGDGTNELYLCSIDYTLGDGQFSPTNYWSVDCGACLVVKLKDNSVFVIDGGHQRQSSKTRQESFLNFLYTITGKDKEAGEKIKIRGWFFSHAHDDHTYFIEPLIKSYHQYIDLENMLFNFPSYQTIKGGYATSVFGTKRTITQYYPDCKVAKLHTGQSFKLQGVNFDVLYSHEDAVSNTGITTITDFNSTSTVLKMTMDGKTFTLLGDSSDKASEIMLKMYTTATLHSDCVQVAHHNYNYLPDLYNAIGAQLALFCNSEINAGYNSGNKQKYLAVIEAAEDVVPLFAYPDNYKITIENDKLAYSVVPGYLSEFETLKPPALSSGLLTGKSGFKEDLNYVLNNKASLLDKVIDRSVIGTSAAERTETGYLILDGDLNTKFSSNVIPASVVWTMKEPSVINSYVIYTANNAITNPKGNPKNWILCGSKDGEEWVVLDSVSNASLPIANSKGTAFRVDNPGEYLYYTIRFFNSEGSIPLQISELGLYSGVTDELQSVIDRINNLPSSVTKEDEAEICSIRESYEKLTEEQKALITNESVLKTAEAALAALNDEPNHPDTPVTPDKPSVTTPTVTNGPTVVNGKTVLYKDGKAVTGTQVVTVSGKTYAVVGGYVKTGKTQVVTISGKSYIVNTNGIVQKGTKNKLIKVGAKSYIVNKSGVVVKGSKNKLVKVGSKSYIVNKKGVVQKGAKNKLVKVGKKSYVVNKKGVVQRNKKKIKVGKKTYRTNKKGVATLKK